MDVSKSVYAYSQLIERIVSDGESVLIVEHDIELTLRALRQAVYCKCEWSTSCYRGHYGAIYANALGCTRFRASFMPVLAAALPIAFADRSFGCDPRHFFSMDARIYAALRDMGQKPHVHDQVPHHHVYQDGCACGVDHAEK